MKSQSIAKKVGWKHYSVSCIVFFIVLSGIAYLVMYMMNKPEISSYRRRVESSESMVIDLQKSYINYNLESIASDLILARNSHLYKKFMEDEIDQSILKESMKNLMENRHDYDQFRYIDEKGMEIIRVDNEASGPVIKESDELQDKSSRYYFIDTMLTEKDQIYQSPIDLNIENGVLEEPYKPMVRVATKVYNDSGDEKGIIIINYNMGDLLDSMKKIVFNTEGDNYFVNSDGYYVSGNDRYDFSFVLDATKDQVGFKDEHAKEWDHVRSNTTANEIYQHYDDQGLITATMIMNAGNQYDQKRWYLVSLLDVEATSIKKDSEIPLLVLKDYLPKVYLHAIFLFIAWAITNVLFTKKIQNNQMYNLAQYDQLTNTYNRNSGLLVIEDNLSYAIRNGYDYALCFIDLNDLKFVNDHSGHEEGDQFIKDSVAILHKGFRKSDIISRVGGDEFIIGMHCSGEIAEKNWEKIRLLIDEFNDSKVRTYHVALSHGVASVQGDKIESLDELVALADQRMYTEKRLMKEGT